MFRNSVPSEKCFEVDRLKLTAVINDNDFWQAAVASNVVAYHTRTSVVAIRSDEWAIPRIGLSSLGEIVGWARPDEFPPRNMRTSKGLRALGYNVRIGA